MIVAIIVASNKQITIINIQLGMHTAAAAVV